MIRDSQPDGPNVLTQPDAEARAARVYDVRYDLTLSLQRESDDYAGEITIRFRHRAPLEGTFVDFTGQRIESLTVNGRRLDEADWRSHRLHLDGALLNDDNILRIHYVNRYDRTGAGFHRFTDPEDNEAYVYSNFEPYEAHRLFPCFDQPDIKGRYRLDVTAPEDWAVIANGPEVVSEAEADGRRRRAFAETPPISSYLFAVVAGPYTSVQDAHEGIPLRLYCRRSLGKFLDPDELFTVTKQGLRFYQEFFDYPYPFAKYDQIFVPEFNAGAMENAGAITFSERMIYRDPPTDQQRLSRAEVVLHEMAHMWFGDLVTMRWWNDLWLNESFASYMSYLALTEATRFTSAWQSFNARMKGWAYHEDQRITTHPIAAEAPDTDATFLNFDGITYGKGASVLKQLVAVIGIDAFRAGMRRYFRAYEWRNATLQDFLGALEHGAGRALGEWSRLWLETAGLNTLTPVWETSGDRITSFAIEQQAPDTHRTLRPHRLDLALIDAGEGGAPVVRATVPVEVAGPRTTVAALVGAAAPACVFPNHGDHAYAKLALDPPSLAFVRARLERFEDPLLRQLLWRTLWDMVRDQQWKSPAYLALVREKLPFERALDLVETVLGNAAAAVAVFVPEERRMAEAEALFELAWERLYAATESDARIVWARAAIGAAQQPATLERMLALVDKGTGIEGFALDQEMRWALAQKQFAFAIPGAAERLRAEEERDPSDRGRRAAASARSAPPDAATKARAWERFTADRDSSLHMIRAAMGGFNWAHQRDLLAPYVERFFDQVRDVFRSRDKDFAQGYFGALYPSYRPDDDVIGRTEALLASLPEAESVLRRTMLEVLDDMRRARACRAFAAS